MKAEFCVDLVAGSLLPVSFFKIEVYIQYTYLEACPSESYKIVYERHPIFRTECYVHVYFSTSLGAEYENVALSSR